MAALKYRDEHNRIGFLEKPKGSTDYHQVIDFLLDSHIRYALVTDPLIYDSLITQFWSTASLRSSELGPPAIVATIDGTPYTITESLVRSKLQLHDEGGIVDMPIPDIFLGMDNLGYPTEGKLTFHKNKFSPQWRFLIHTLLHCLSTKSGSWDQFGTPLAIALICLCEGKKYNWSRYIFTGMVNNINNSKKFLMFPRFLQLILDIETRNPKPYHAVRLTSKMFANMRLNFHGDHMPLVAAMLPPTQAAIAAGTSGEAVPPNPQTDHETVTEPVHQTASPHDHGSTSPRPTPTIPAAQMNEPVSKPPRPIPTSPSAQVNQQGPSTDPHVESSSKDNDDDPLRGSFFASPSRSTAAPPEGTTSGGAADPHNLTALYTLVSEQGKKIEGLESELQAHKLLFKDVMGKLEDEEQDVDSLIKLAKAAALAADTSSVPADATKATEFPPSSSIHTDAFVHGNDVPSGTTSAFSVDPVEEENPKSKDGVVSSEQNGKQSEDPFNIYSLLNKDKMKNNKEASTKESLEYPPGFTPRENDVENVEMDNQKDNCDGEFGNVNNISDEVNFSSGFNTYKKAGGESMDSDHCRESEGSRKGGSILMLMDELVKVGQTMGYNMDGCMKNIEEIIESQGVDGVNFLTLQETKMESIDLFEIKRCWGNFAFDYVHSASVGKSGGILCVWDPNAFKKLNSTASDYFVMIQGNWVSNGKLLLIISVYAPQELSEKKSLWDYLCHVIDNWKGSVIIMGDFNEVRNKNERFGTIFNVHGANAFNSFISMANLEEVPLGGCSFTWCHRSASKMSKLDRFLMSESLLSECPNLSAITLDRFLSDHRPILLRESTHDYGPIPFRFFHYWLEMEGFENFVNEVWREAPVDNSNAMINMMNKLKYLKKKIRVWNGMRQSPKTRKHVLKQELADLEMIIDKGDASSDTLHKRAEVVKSIQEVDKLCAMEASQKAKIKWAIEGDENSKYYHGILNKKRNQLSIRGVLVEGDWVENPNMVKNEFLNHFKNRFDRPKSVRPMLNMEFPHHLNSMQQLDLEAEVSNEEIKKAVWDCGVDKSPGPDGFTFGFYKRFWSLIEKDVLAAVKYFFHYSRIPKGCNSSFIALIPKTPEAKMVKDFRPISLIGSLYKIIAKILANRLVVVLGDIVNEVQSAFVADRQILDGPFILNEVLQWCKLKKKHSFILKIDFEKAYDSVRWDYLDDVLRKFGFGEKWCGWIQECLRSSWGSVLVNGSPTEEFQFFKGLKQGDPLSPFIFILVMESLHISFKRVVDAGMFNGIVLNSVMHLSHMFYADDAVFMGQWSTKNIDTIIYVLKCFHRASGLSINLSKSKLLGVVVSEDRVVQAANRIGCGVLKAPFAYLGSKVGGNMSRIKSWDEIVDKMVDRLSKWKMKTLSIGGRLTLLKAVLGSMPIYHMSIFKVPMKVLQRMESIRSRFFSGVDLNSKKSIWVKWSKVLCSKEKGGLGVSSLYALNRALMCKWVWRFTTQKNLLWTRVIKAIHGEDGKNGSGFKVGYKSIWRSILQEVETLKIKGIHLNNFMQKKLGNGADTYFWEDLWHGDMVLKQRYPRLYALEVKKTVDVASKLSQENLTWSFRRAPRSGVEQDQLTDLTTYVEGVVLGVTPDRWYWTLDGSGEFSVASARKVIDDNRFPEVSTQTRWIKAVPIKVNIHAWKVRMDCLPTRLNISRRGIDIPSILCPVCGSVTESSSHLFFDCLVAKDNFRKICRWWEVDFMEVHTFDEWVSWIVNLRIPIKHKRLLEGVCFGLWWLIWAYRNKCVFGVVSPSKADIFDDVVSYSFYWSRFRCNVSFSWVDWLKNPHLITL
ncbi:RNA-directed DNA polymerase, eukaryota [Tanacetum coccineum]|uniref:RNA-directed DNA polymerase, eukaryota n=1 Tax=Tanacetum coccineum TaxID=301880 RepID=A0ABQ5F8U4_9ASTR